MTRTHESQIVSSLTAQRAASRGSTVPLLEVKNVRHFYKKREALKGLSFTVSEGEIFGLLGPNGSGKTTLFRILATLFPPFSGEIQVLGKALWENLFEMRRRMGVVFQSPSLDGKLTVFENLCHQGRLYGLYGKKLKERCEEVLTRLTLKERSQELVEKLSGGLKRRVELAKALLHRPEILILDEPSTGLDPAARLELWKYLEELRVQASLSVLVTTHLMEEAEHCHRVAILNEGALVSLGRPEDLKHEVGGDVVILKTGRPEEMARKIKEKFSLEPVILEGLLHMECSGGASLIPQLSTAFQDQIEWITVRKPSLEDVFLHKTGYAFRAGEEALR